MGNVSPDDGDVPDNEPRPAGQRITDPFGVTGGTDDVAERLARVRDLRERLFAAGTTLAGADGAPRDLFPVAIGLAEGLALRDWVRTEGARETLEIGLGYGIAALFICEGLLAQGSDVRHVAVDPYQLEGLPPHQTLFAGAGLAHLDEAAVRDIVELYCEESQIVLPRLLAGGRRFDLAFIDGSHRFEAVFLDLIYAGRLVRDYAAVFVDDAQIASVRKAIDFCVTNLGWTVEDEGTEGASHAWVVLRTSGADVFFRPYTAFIDF